jgi:hypothetical protein
MNCYIYNENSKHSLPSKVMDKSITLFYPEKSMTMEQQFKTARPRDFHIVTDSPFLVSLYKNHEVFYLQGKKWIQPTFQTYGCAYRTIMSRLWNAPCIPQAVLDGKVTNILGMELDKNFKK